jgi:hypothetical protein
MLKQSGVAAPSTMTLLAYWYLNLRFYPHTAAD